MEAKEDIKELSYSILIFIILMLECLMAFSLWRLKERVEDIEQRQLEVNEYILNRIGG